MFRGSTRRDIADLRTQAPVIQALFPCQGGAFHSPKVPRRHPPIKDHGLLVPFSQSLDIGHRRNRARTARVCALGSRSPNHVEAGLIPYRHNHQTRKRRWHDTSCRCWNTPGRIRHGETDPTAGRILKQKPLMQAFSAVLAPPTEMNLFATNIKTNGGFCGGADYVRLP
jgi:hypothetical protein